MSDKYFVWRRSDGYVAASTSSTAEGWTQSNGVVVSFEHLATFDKWGAEIIDFIEEYRSQTIKEKP